MITVRAEGLEPSLHRNGLLRPARLPVPPRPHDTAFAGCNGIGQTGDVSQANKQRSASTGHSRARENLTECKT